MLKNKDIPDIFTPVISDSEIVLICVTVTPVPELSLTVVINKDLMVSAFYKNLPLTVENEFLKGENKRAIASKLMNGVLNITENYLDVETCKNDHAANSLCTEIIKKSTNIFLKGDCKKMNDQLNFEALSKNQKLSTFNKT